jgi:hypothetical protein
MIPGGGFSFDVEESQRCVGCVILAGFDER